MIYWVLGTDPYKHNKHKEQLDATIAKEGFNPNTERKMLVRALLHGADISNGTRPIETSKAWSLRVLEEFFN